MNRKLLGREDLAAAVATLRQAAKQVVFTNGCFDILHAGHVRYLAQARAAGDALVIGLNADASVRIIKGPSRPLVPQEQRAEVLAALACVDWITIFDEPDPLALITCIGPDILVKGADWPEDAIIGSDVVKARGGKVVRIPVVPDISTTRIIEKILNVYGGQNRVHPSG